jgi:hypothetical protein
MTIMAWQQSQLSKNCNFNSHSTISKFYYYVDQFNKTKGLSIIHINCESIVKKIEEIRIFCCVYKPDILYISESWLQEQHNDYDFRINGYDIQRRDRSEGRDGGSIIYSELNSNLKYERIYFEENSDITYVTLKLSQTQTHDFYVS